MKRFKQKNTKNLRLSNHILTTFVITTPRETHITFMLASEGSFFLEHTAEHNLK